MQCREGIECLAGMLAQAKPKSQLTLDKVFLMSAQHLHAKYLSFFSRFWLHRLQALETQNARGRHATRYMYEHAKESITQDAMQYPGHASKTTCGWARDMANVTMPRTSACCLGDYSGSEKPSGLACIDLVRQAADMARLHRTLWEDSRRGGLVVADGGLELGIASTIQVAGRLHCAEELCAVRGQALSVGLALGCTCASCCSD